MIRPGEEGGMWDEQDGFFYDVLRLPDGRSERLKVRSMVGLLPFCAVTIFEGKLLTKYPEVGPAMREYLKARPELMAFIHDPQKPGHKERLLGSILNEANLRRVLTIMLDEKEFLSPFGIRAISRIHQDHPYIYRVGDQEYRVSYLPGESDSGMFGGNSNWRGPIWMPVNMLILRALLQYYLYYGNSFTIECPTGSGKQMNLYEVAEEIGRRLSRIFLKDEQGKRPVHGTARKFQEDPHWKDYPLFYEYFHGDTGAGVGASHQTGWSGAIARIMHLFASSDARADARAEQRKNRRAGPLNQARKTMTKVLHPSLYQVNTRVWLTELSETLGRPATLDDIPDAELDRLAGMGFDWVWFLSVWRTGKAGQKVSRENQRVAAGVPGDAAGFARGGHRRLRICHHRL